MLCWPPGMRTISSRQNEVVRAVRDLVASPDASGRRVLVDGPHLVAEALAAGLVVPLAAVSAHGAASPEIAALADRLDRSGARLVAVTGQILASMSPVRTPSGIVAVVERQPASLDALCVPSDAFLLVAVDVQDPGNVGAILRVAEAAGATGAIVAGASANPFSAKAVRGSMGSVLRLPVTTARTSEVAGRFRAAGVRAIGATVSGGALPDAVTWRGRVALVLGGEGGGLPADVLAWCDATVSLPMQAPVESLNVAVAAGILAYHARSART